MNPIAPYNFAALVAWKTLTMLINKKVLLYPSGVAFCVWRRGDRMIIAFNPEAIELKRIDDQFIHDLSTKLEGRLVVRTNSRGMFLQVELEVPPAPAPLVAQDLDLNQQATPWHMPIGMTKNGPLWLSLIEEDSFLVGGSRRKGKSGLTHGMIQALLHGGRTEVYGWDGKGGVEFGRYIGMPNFHYIHNADHGLNTLTNVLAARLEQLRMSGFPNILTHNQAGKDFITPIALFVDEVAELEDSLKEAIKRMVKFYGAAGLYPVLATNDPVQSAILVKTNLSTRICFAVPSFNDSLTVLGMKGAEALNQRGRGLLLLDNRLIEFQSFTVNYPKHDEEMFRQHVAALDVQAAAAPSSQESEITQLAESIRAAWMPGMSKRAVAKLLKKTYAGAWAAKTDKIIEYLSATTTTQTPDLSLEGAA
jgi:hypothetical protein